MIYSKWRTDVGGYDLLESESEKRALGNDMPVPAMIPSSPIGMPSVECGRKPGKDAKARGTSAVPVGSVMVTKAGSLMGLDDVPGGWSGIFMLLTGVSLGAVVAKRFWR